MTLAATAGAQVLLGGFQGAGDSTDAGWYDNVTGDVITSDANYSFVQAGVPGFQYSLAASPGGGGFGHPDLQLNLTAAQVAAFNTNSYLTFVMSVVPGTNTTGYYQLYNLAASSSAGTNYGNLITSGIWTNYSSFKPTTSGDTASTGNNANGMPNFYFYSGEEAMFSEIVSIHYSSLMTNSVLANDTTAGLNLYFQFNQGEHSLPVFINSVTLSQTNFTVISSSAVNGSVYIVDDFSTNGVGPENPTNDDYYTATNVYEAGQVTNVWWNWFGSDGFSNTVYAPGVSPSYAPSQGSLQINLDWTGASAEQFELWNQGSPNDDYGMNLSALTYTNFQCDVMYAPGSATNASGNFGLLQFGNRPPSYGQDYFGGGNFGISVASTNAGVWQHVSIPLNPTIDTNLLQIEGLLIHTYDGSGQLNGPSTIYVDNIEFVGPLVVTKIPQPTVSLQPAKPGLRMFVGSGATYIREGVITTQNSGEKESWIGASGPVTYSFQLLSYPPANLGVTELAILPENSFNTTANFQTTIYNNPYLDYQDSNGLYVAIAPFNSSGAVTAMVQWKVGVLNSGPTNTMLTITNPTAIGTWTLTMNSATSGTLTAPGGQQGNFTIADPNISSDFANPVVAAFFEQPNATAGYGLYEDIGTISITGTASGTQTENFANETSDFNNGTSPGGFYQNNYSVDPGNLVITRGGLDAYWVNWTTPASGFYLVTSTNILSNPTNWIAPIFYSDYNIPDEAAPRGNAVEYGTKYWELLPMDDLPTADGNVQPTAPAITDPLAPDAYFMLTTNFANIYPLGP